MPRKPTKRTSTKPKAKANAKPKTKAKAKAKARAKPTPKSAGPAKAAAAIDLAEHNRHLAILGLPSVRAPLVEGPPAQRKPAAKAGSPLAMLDQFYAGEGPTSPRGRFIHWWGQFSGLLPKPFTLKQGGHGYIEARDVEHATRLFAKLRNAVLTMKPDPDDDDDIDDDDREAAKEFGLKATCEWAGISGDGMVWYRWMLTDGRQMTVELKIKLLKHDLSGARLIRIK